MLEALVLVLDGDFELPLYADPDVEDIDPDVLARFVQFVDEVAEGDRKPEGIEHLEEWHLGYKVVARTGVAFCAQVTDDVEAAEVTAYLNGLARLYADEVDDPRNPDSDGLGDLLLDVIPPWEE